MCAELQQLTDELREWRRIAATMEQVLDADDTDDDESFADDPPPAMDEAEQQEDLIIAETPPLDELVTSRVKQLQHTALQRRTIPVVTGAVVGTGLLIGAATVVSGGTVWLGLATASLAGGSAGAVATWALRRRQRYTRT